MKSSYVESARAELRTALDESGGAETSRVHDARNYLEMVEGIEAARKRVADRQKRFATWTPGIIVDRRRVRLRITDLDEARRVWTGALDTAGSPMIEAGLRRCIAATASPVEIAVLTSGFLKEATGDGFGMVDRRPWASWQDCIDMLMGLTVPLHVRQLSSEPFASLTTFAAECASIIGERGDGLGFHTGKDAAVSATANALSIGLAIQAIACADGAAYRGMRWHVEGAAS